MNVNKCAKAKSGYLRFAWGVAEAKCILDTAVGVSVHHHIPTLLHWPGCNLGNGRGCPLVAHHWADLQSVHGFHCYDNIIPNEKCQRLLVLALCLVCLLVMCNTAMQTHYTPTFIGLMCLSASSTNCVWWCADARTAMLHSIWRYIGHQSLRPHHDSIFVRLPAINWRCRHIGGPHMAVVHSLSLVRRRGTHCQNVYVIPLLVLLFLPMFWKHSSSQSTSVSSALEALAIMRYINLHFTLQYKKSTSRRFIGRPDLDFSDWLSRLR